MIAYSSAAGLDIWEKLGNKGWNAKTIRPYFSKFQKFIEPSEKTKALFQSEEKTNQLPVGSEQKSENSGLITTAVFEGLGTIERDFIKSFNNLDPEPPQADPINGVTRGAYPIPASYNPQTSERSYSVTGYFLPAASRPNLHILTGAHVTKVLFNGKRAKGVEFLHKGQQHEITAGREVLLSAGAFQSPQLLELSGIGSPGVLANHGIPLIVPNTAVGSNLQDHLITVLLEPTINKESTIFNDPTRIHQAIGEFMSSRSGPLSKFIGTSAFIPLSEILKSGEVSDPAKFLSKHLEGGKDVSVQHQLIKELLEGPHGASTQFELLPSYLRPPTAGAPEGHCIIVNLPHPFSRGHTHIQSSDPLSPPKIDPNYLSHPIDREILALSVQHAENVVRTSPFSDHIQAGERKFTKGENPEADLQNAKDYVTMVTQSTWHPTGTCAMLPQDKHGVVDANFRVYGTVGLRVVDASVFPIIPQGNPQTLVYAVAERASDIIKLDLASN